MSQHLAALTSIEESLTLVSSSTCRRDIDRRMRNQAPNQHLPERHSPTVNISHSHHPTATALQTTADRPINLHQLLSHPHLRRLYIALSHSRHPRQASAAPMMFNTRLPVQMRWNTIIAEQHSQGSTDLDPVKRQRNQRDCDTIAGHMEGCTNTARLTASSIGYTIHRQESHLMKFGEGDDINCQTFSTGTLYQSTTRPNPPVPARLAVAEGCRKPKGPTSSTLVEETKGQWAWGRRSLEV